MDDSRRKKIGNPVDSLFLVRLSALLKGAFALILKMTTRLFGGIGAPKHKYFSAGKLHFVRLFKQAQKGW